MVIWSTIEASCPICGNRTRLREVGSGFIRGQDSDLLVRMKGKHIIQAEVHSCLKCRFSGYAGDFLRNISLAARRRFIEGVSRTLAAEPGAPVRPAEGPQGTDPVSTPLPDVQYYWAFRTAEALALPPTAQGERLLRAYWCLRLPPSSSLAPARIRRLKRLYLRGAVQKLRQGLRFERDRHWLYLIAELCRRNGSFLLAESYFRRFLEVEEGAKYLRQAARKLVQLARARVSDELGMEEVLYDDAPDPNRLHGDDHASRDAG